MLEKLLSLVSHIPRSRVHALKTFGSAKVKRDDELGFGVSGSKARKYASLIPYLIKQGFQEVAVIGSAHSNHVLGISQHLVENRIKPLLFLLGDPSIKRQGNYLLTSLLVPEGAIRWVSRKEWPEVEKLAAGMPMIPEGACMDEALPGALTLALDIEEHYDHIFLDAGTGLSAIATILGFSYLKRKTVVHVLLLADQKEQFLQKLERFQKSFERIFAEKIDTLSPFQLHLPTEAKSFGSVNASVIDHIKILAREEGFFTDPIYSAKLFWEAKKILPRLEGNVLIVHSGGALTIMGFQEKFIM